MNTALKSIMVVASMVLVGVLIFSMKNKPLQEEVSTIEEGVVVNNTEETNQSEADVATTISLPLASMKDSGDFGPFGCGQYINFHSVEVPKTEGVLTAVYNQLFDLPYEVAGTEDKNIIASQENLNFDSVMIENGDMKLYLNGFVMGNHCADEVFRHQIQEAAFQFDTVNSITVYVNNEIFDWCSISDAGPDEGFCAEGPLLWIKERE